MNRIYTSLITASVLALVGTAASGQLQTDSHRESMQVAERLTQQRPGLYSAIAIAETHTKGVAIGVRLSTNRDLSSRQPDQRRTRSDDQPDQRQTRSEDQPSTQPGPLFAIVTCVIDKTKVRDVVIDMETGTVTGVQTATFRNSRQGDADWRPQYDHDYSSGYDGDSASLSSEDGRYALASDLMNASVTNKADEDLGDIDELAIDPDTNRVVYGVLRRGGFLGMGESRYAIPCSELATLRSGRIVLDMDESRFEGISGFDNDNWPTKAEKTLTADRKTQAKNAPAAKRVVKASSIIGTKIHSSDGNTPGEISDLVIDSRTERVLYAVVNTDRGQMAVPMVTLKKTDKTYTLPMSMDKLRSMPMLNTKRNPNWSDENWNRSIHESYGVQFETPSTRDND